MLQHSSRSLEIMLKLISCKCKKACQKARRCRKTGLKCSVICTKCSGANSQVPSHESDEEEETKTIFEQTNDGFENEEDYDDEADNPIADGEKEKTNSQRLVHHGQQSEGDCDKFQNCASHVYVDWAYRGHRVLYHKVVLK